MTDDPKKPTLVPRQENIVPLDRDNRLIDRIKALIANPPEGSVVLEITPYVARWIIEVELGNLRGTHNRKQKESAIERYAADMRSPGGWLLNGSTIVFTDQGLLGDGQNRLIACIRAGKPFKSHVIFGVPHVFFYSMDQGRVRGPADILHIEGVANAPMVYPAVRWCELLDRNIVKSRQTYTGPQILELYRTKHKGVEDFIKEAKDVLRTNEHQAVSEVMAALYTFTKIDADLAAKLFQHWSSCTYPGQFRALSLLQQELAYIATGSKSGSRKQKVRINDVVRVAMIINTWNIIRTGVKPRLAIIRWDFGKPFPKIDGKSW